MIEVRSPPQERHVEVFTHLNATFENHVLGEHEKLCDNFKKNMMISIRSLVFTYSRSCISVAKTQNKHNVCIAMW